MKLILAILILQIFLSCKSTDKRSARQTLVDTIETANKGVDSKDKNYVVDPKALLRDFNTWYSYTYDNILLSQDFVGLNTDSVAIDKSTFLNELMTKKVVAFKVKRVGYVPVYKLFKHNSLDKSITSAVRQLASIELKHFKMEGKMLPPVRFSDLKGNSYDIAAMTGKIVVLKCWFIHCVACVKEFPECNRLVDENKQRKDIIFISLASDPKQDLEKFLKKRPFNYAVIPEMDSYMTDKLEINQYPTHLLIDKTGKIVKVVNSLRELEPFLKKLMDRPVDGAAQIKVPSRKSEDFPIAYSQTQWTNKQ